MAKKSTRSSSEDQRPEVVIHDGNAHLHTVDPVIDGERKARGGIPRNFDTHPVGCYASAPAMHAVQPFPLVNMSDVPKIIADKIAAKSQLSDIRMKGNNGQPFPSRDQNGRGYCWMHSGVGALLYVRAKQHMPYADLSAYGPACVIKHFADEGGWGAQGVDWLRDKGCPTSKTWPQQSTSRSNDSPATWAEAALYKVTDGWWDLQASQYDRKLSVQQMITLLLSDVPVVTDFNWWSHSVCAIDAVDGAAQMGIYRNQETGKLVKGKAFDAVWMSDPVMAGISIRIQNSWGDSWSDRGMGILTGSKAIPDSAVAPALALAG